MRWTALTLVCFLISCTDHRAGRTSDLNPSITEVDFRTRTELPLHVEQSVDVAIVDLDGDGTTDMAALDLAGKVVILQGLGNGEFAVAQELPITGIPLAILAADLDGDQALDLVTISDRSDVATVFRNLGSGSFAEHQVVPVENLPTDMVLGDFTGDDVSDLVVTHLSRSDVLIFEGVGDGTFGPSRSLTIPRGTRTSGLTLGDLDGDGFSDLMLCDTDNEQIVILFGPESSKGASPIVVPVGETPVAISLGDVNLDGQVDIAVSCFDSMRVDFVTKTAGGGEDGTDSWGVFRSIAISGKPALSVFADLDNDGEQDLSVCVLNRSAVSIFDGGEGGLGDDEYQLPATGFPYKPIAADIAGDGRVDLALVSSRIDRMNVYEVTDDGLHAARTFRTQTPRPQLVTAADFDGDGTVEIATVGSRSGVVSIVAPTRQALGAVFEEVWSTDVTLELGNCRAADVDRDGRPDLLLAVEGGMKVLANETTTAGYAFRAVPAGTDVLAPGTIATDMAAGDVDGDGFVDLVATYFFDDKVVLLRGTANPFEFAAPVETPLTGSPLGLVLADFDRDGALEVAVTRANLATVTLLELGPDGDLVPQLDVPVGPAPTFMQSADFDGDGRADLALSSSNGNRMQMLLATVGGGFRLQEVETGETPTALLARDIDDDGFPDVLVATLRGTTFEVLLGDGLGGIRARRVFPGVYGAVSAVLEDVDGSSEPDLVVGSGEIDRLFVFRNDSVRIQPQ